MNSNQSPNFPKNPRPIAIIGAGGIVTDAHLPAYSIAGWKVTGIYDIDFGKAKAARNKFKIVDEAFEDIETLIRKASGAKAVFDLAVPANKILPILDLLPEGATVLVQKPMGETLAEAKEIAKVCRQKNFVAAVNFQLKFAPFMLAAKDIIAQGILGTVYDMELKLCTYTPWHLWDFLKEKPRMEVLYHSIHYVDLIRSFLGVPSKVYGSLTGQLDLQDLAETKSAILFSYGAFTQARILTNHGHRFGTKHQESYFKVEGTKGALKITLGLSLDYPKGKPSKFEYYQLEEQLWKEVPLTGDWFPHAFIGSMSELQLGAEDPDYEISHGLEASLQTMSIVEAIYDSNATGGTTINSEKF